MRTSLIALIPAAALLAGCGNDKAVDAAPESTSKAAAIIAAAADQARQEPGKPGNRALKEALPGGVLPDFAYNTTVDMTSTAPMTMRQVHLDLPDLSAQESLDRIVAQFEAAGLEAGEQGNQEALLVRSVWTPIEGGGKGLAVVDAGGTHIALMALDHEADDPRRDDGYVSVLRLQINSK